MKPILTVKDLNISFLQDFTLKNRTEVKKTKAQTSLGPELTSLNGVMKHPYLGHEYHIFTVHNATRKVRIDKQKIR